MDKILIQKIKRFLFPLKRIQDDAVIGISIVNAGMLHEGNLYLMEYAVKNLPTDDSVLEIGSFCGLSTNIIAYLIRKHNKNNRFFSSDKWDFEEQEQSNFIYKLNVDYNEYQKFVKDSFVRNLQFFCNKNLPYSIELFSDDFFELWKKRSSVIDVFGRYVELGGKLSFCHIDGNHSYDFVKRDFVNADKWLVKGGFILFDDSADHYTFGSSKFMKEIKANKTYEIVMKNPNYLVRKKN